MIHMDPRIEERRLITILFADLSGFTALSSKLDPEEVQEAANLCFERLNKVIVGRGGTIHKYEGDLVIALFGFPVTYEDDPERALQAAFEMFGLLPEINSALASRLGMKADLGLHVGINSGTVVVGEVGSEEKREYTVMGDPVNLASRMKDVAKRGEILVSEPVYRASQYLYDYEAPRLVDIKGFEEPVKTFKPLRRKEKPDSKRGIKGLHSPLVGREKEFARLCKAVEELSEGKGGVCFVLGDAGLGKSRILEELKQTLPGLSAQVSLLEGRCLAYTENVPYWPFLLILSQIAGISDRDDKEGIQRKLLARSQELLPGVWEEVVPYLGYLFSVRFGEDLDAKVKYLEPKDLKTQIFLSLRLLLAALAGTQPLLLVIDDYHWMDPASLEFLVFLFEDPEPRPLHLLALSRIEKGKEAYKTRERLKQGLGDRYQEILLEPLDPKAGSEMVYNLLNVPGIAEGFKDKILAKAAGNPFYLEEIVRSLIDSGVLVQTAGVWHLTAPVESLTIPDTVQAVIAARLDRLEREVRDILQMAAVIGRNFPVSVLGHLCRMDHLMLTLYLADLESFAYIHELKRDPELEYVFRHPLLQEVAYNGLVKKERRMLHRKAGEAIETLYRDRLDDFTELLAYQYAHSDQHEKAISWLQRAGEKAKARYANEEAISYFEQLATLLEKESGHIPEVCATYEALGDIFQLKGDFQKAHQVFGKFSRAATGNSVLEARARRKMAQIYWKQDLPGETLAALEEADQKIPGNSLPENLERAANCTLRTWVYKGTGEMDKAVQEGEKGLRIAEEAEKTAAGEELRMAKMVKARALNVLGMLLSLRDKSDQAVELISQGIALLRELGDLQGVGGTTHNLGRVYEDKGESRRALALFQESEKLFESIGYKEGLGIANNSIGSVLEEEGEYEQALERFQRYLRISEEIGYHSGIAGAKCNIANILNIRGDSEGAFELYQQHFSYAASKGDAREQGLAHYDLGYHFLLQGRLIEAEEHLRKAVSCYQKIGDKSTLSKVYSYLAEVKARQGSVAQMAEAQALLGKAVQVAEETGSASGKALCFLTQGKISTAAGDFVKAAENFQGALRIYEELQKRKPLADAYLEYAKALKAGAAQGLYPPALAEDYFSRARRIYEDLRLFQKAKECC